MVCGSQSSLSVCGNRSSMPLTFGAPSHRLPAPFRDAAAGALLQVDREPGRRIDRELLHAGDIGRTRELHPHGVVRPRVPDRLQTNPELVQSQVGIGEEAKRDVARRGRRGARPLAPTCLD